MASKKGSSNNAARSKGKGRFVANPNSKAAQKRAAKKAKEAAAAAAAASISATPPRPGIDVPFGAAPTEVSPQKPAESAETLADGSADGGAGNTADDDVLPPQNGSHVDGWTPPPARNPDGIDDDDDNGDVSETPRHSAREPWTAAKRKKQRYVVDKLLQGLCGGFETYTKLRHSWVDQVATQMAAQGMKEQADMLLTTKKVSEEEREMLTDTVSRFMEHKGIEISPELELALVVGGIFGGKIMTLEGTLFTMKKAGVM